MDPKIPGYKIEDRIGRGGMGKVYLAVQESLSRKVAIKLILPSLAEDERLREQVRRRFWLEAGVLAELDHPNIVRVIDRGELRDGNYYFIMHYYPGGSLDQRKQNLSTEEKLSIVEGLLEALIYAHGKNIVHRDIKPHNIVFKEDGNPVLTDFGIVRVLGTDDTSLTRMLAQPPGSPPYMSPEQLKRESIDCRTDLYSLGVVFYELLTGDRLYTLSSGPDERYAEALRHIDDPVPLLTPEFAAFQELLNGLVAKQRDQRFPDAENALRALKEAKERYAIESRAGPRPLPKGRTYKIRKGQGVAVSLGVIIPLGLLGYLAAHVLKPPSDALTLQPPESVQEDPSLPTHRQQEIDARQVEQQRLEIEAAERRQRQESIAAILSDARAYLDQGEYAASLNVLDQGIEQWPDSAALVTLREQMIAQQQQAHQREQGIERYLQLALQYRQQADYQQSLATIDNGLQRWPDADELLDLRRAVQAQLDEQRRRAEEKQRRAVRAEQRLAECDQHLEDYDLTTGEGGNAYDCYHEVLAYDENNPRALEGLRRIPDRYAQFSNSRSYANLLISG